MEREASASAKASADRRSLGEGGQPSDRGAAQNLTLG